MCGSDSAFCCHHRHRSLKASSGCTPSGPQRLLSKVHTWCRPPPILEHTCSNTQNKQADSAQPSTFCDSFRGMVSLWRGGGQIVTAAESAAFNRPSGWGRYAIELLVGLSWISADDVPNSPERLAGKRLLQICNVASLQGILFYPLWQPELWNVTLCLYTWAIRVNASYLHSLRNSLLLCLLVCPLRLRITLCFVGPFAFRTTGGFCWKAAGPAGVWIWAQRLHWMQGETFFFVCFFSPHLKMSTSISIRFKCVMSQAETSFASSPNRHLVFS